MEKIKYDISVDNRYLRRVKSSLEDDEIKILEKHDMPDFGTLLIVEGTIEEIKDWCMWNEFDFSELNIRK
jgi:hypothetical protein